MHKLYYLYKITNLINNKVYIGQSSDPRRRWSDHKREALKDSPSMLINKRMKHYGIDNFTFEVIASCWNYDDANDVETLLVKQYNSHVSNGEGYNVAFGGMNAPKSDEWKQKMREWHATLSEDEKQRLYGNMQAHANDWKKEHQEEFLNNCRKAALGTHHSEEWKAHASEIMTGRKMHSLEFRQKMSENKKGKRKLTPEQMELIKQDTAPQELRERSSRTRPYALITAEYGISKNTIRRTKGLLNYPLSRLLKR